MRFGLHRFIAPARAFSSFSALGPMATNNWAEQAKKLQDKPAPPGHKIIREGNGVMIFPEQNKVFYNNVQVLNRDLSINMISEFARSRAREQMLKQQKRDHAAAGGAPEAFVPTEISDAAVEQHLVDTAESSGIRIFEALSASGLRSIRYFQQIPGVKSIVVNDMDAAAVESIQRNVEFNELPLDRVIPRKSDAMDAMYNSRKDKDQFDVIDLDPYGSASIFLDGAVQSVTNGGLLCVTCTDMAVLSGKNPEVCFSRYGSVPNKANYLHEMALRMGTL
jgi:tRNA (guanine26-N2/guanine27-N2)-dimethyltransferase